MIPFNPFTIGPDHDDHSNSTEIIKLEESGQVFCPLCLTSSYHRTDGIRDEIFDKYVRGLFEALDQHGEKRCVREIVLSIIEIILSKRGICILSDHDFHNLLRIIYKILNSEKFCPTEFPAVTQMLSAITRTFACPIMNPLVSVSKATEKIVECAGKQLTKHLDERTTSLRSDVLKLLKSVFTTIRAYLELLSRFAIGPKSGLMFPLSEEDHPQLHSWNYHEGHQNRCLKFAQIRLFPISIRHLKSVNSLDRLERDLVLSLFETVRECFISAIRVDNTEFIKYLMKEDVLMLAHTYSYKCTDDELRVAVRSFLKAYVLHYVESKFVPDKDFYNFAAQDDIVDTNHRNAIVYSQVQAKSSRAIFYVMVSCIAYDQKSEYYNQDRLKKVISEVDPSLFFSSNSKAISKVYLYAASTTIRSVSVVDHIEKFFRKSWNQAIDVAADVNFEDEFCSDEKIFFWAHRHPSFKKLITWRSIKRLVEIGFSRISIAHSILKLLNDEFYREHIIKYMENDETSVKLIERFIEPIDGCGFHVGDRFHIPLMTKLGAIIPTLLYDAIQKLTDRLYDPECMAKVKRLTKMILLWMDHCTQFDLLLDDDFIEAWFRLWDEIMARQLRKGKKFEGLVILFLKIICSLMESNHSQLIKILTSLNYTSLGLMYNRLMNYTIGDELPEKIANMILAYDELDYPLAHDPVDGLVELKPNILNWMFSNNIDLHKLSIRCIEKTLRDQESHTTRVVVATGLVYMIYENSDILKNRRYAEIIRSIFPKDEVLYNPLLSRLKCRLPEAMAVELSQVIDGSQVSPPPSPAISFDSDESDSLEEENISVIRILTQLQNEDTSEADNSYPLPYRNSLFVSEGLIDRHVNSVDTDNWPRLAYEINHNR